MLRIGQVEVTAQNNKYTDGNVAGGVPATRLRAAALNAFQEELAGIVESAGLDLDPDDFGQVLKALKLLFAAKTESLGALAALTGAKDKLPYFTGADAATLTDLTSVGRDILASATKVAVLEYLGLGDLPNFGTAASKNVGTGAGQIPDMSSFASQLGNPAVFEFPNGLIIQMGTTSITSGNHNITLPKAFPNAHIAGTGVMNPDVSATNIENVQAWPSSNSTLRLQSAYISGSSIGPITSGLVCWICAGY